MYGYQAQRFLEEHDVMSVNVPCANKGILSDEIRLLLVYYCPQRPVY